jgi:G:T-mismatch repair DNA endonuclease (very short patch repair protein)
MNICQRCGNNHDSSYGSGKYCSKKCAFTKNENQLAACRKPKSVETRIKMSKPKSDTSKMGKRDKSGDKNPNSYAINGKLKDRNNSAYQNICEANKRNGLGWLEENCKAHSEKMKGESNWMKGKKHSRESIDKMKLTIQEKYSSGKFNSFTRSISKAEREIMKYLTDNGINFISQYIIKGSPLRYDLYLPNKNIIIEYYGDYWHGNPKIYKKDSLLGRGTNKYTAEEKWATDKKKENYAINAGYSISIIWESDFNSNKHNILNTLL